MAGSSGAAAKGWMRGPLDALRALLHGREGHDRRLPWWFAGRSS